MFTATTLRLAGRPRRLQRALATLSAFALLLQSSAAFAPVQATGGAPDLTTCTLYGYQDEGVSDSQFFRMNLQTGAVTNIGGIANDEDLEAIDTQPSTGTIFGFPDNGSDDSSAVLVTVNRETGARTFVANVSSDYELPGASFNPVTGELWAGADTNDNLYTINLTTGAPTLKLDASQSGEPQALAWNLAGTLLYVAYNDKVYTTNGSSALELVADVAGEIEAMEFDELSNLLVGVHGDINLYVLVGDSLIDTGKNFASDVETLTTACRVEPPTGSVKVDKRIDTDGDGTFESGNDAANDLGFRWGLDGATPNRLMGSSADATAGDHAVSENSVAGYHFVGWFLSTASEEDDDDNAAPPDDRASLTDDASSPTSNGDDDDEEPQFSCQNPQGTTLPVPVSIGAGGGDDDPDNDEDGARLVNDTPSTKEGEDDDEGDDGDDDQAGNVTVTLCNARDTGTLRVVKHVVGEAQASDWQLHVKRDGTEVSGSPQDGTESGTVYTLPTNSYLVSETGGPAGFAQSFSGDCNGDGLVTVATGQEKTCTLTNTENPPDQASLTVIKHAVGGSAEAADWTMHIKQGETDVFSFAGNEAPGTTKPLSPGSYRVTESSGPDGYTLGYSGDCDASGDVSLSAGEHATCTLTNTRDQGRIKIVKVLSDESDPNAWTFTISGQAGDVHHNEDVTLDTGTYTVTEHGPQGYTLTDASGICSIVDTQVRLQVTTDNGTCTLTNTKNPERPQLTVVKHVVGSTQPASDFTMHVDGQSFPGSEQGTTRSIDPGAYTVTETGGQGFALAYSGDCNGQGQVTLAHDEQKTCTLTNTRTTGTLIVQKDVLGPNGEPIDDVHPFTVTRNGGDEKTIAERAEAQYLNLPTGTYSIIEQPTSGYTLQGYSLDLDGDGGNGAQVAVGSGVTALLITNRQAPNSISGTKWHDLDRDGLRDAGEPGLSNWTIRLTSACEPDITKYDLVPNGRVDASDLSSFAADYATTQALAELNQDGAVNTLDLGCFTGRFGQSTETWAAAFALETTTDASGQYAFANLPTGSYLVSEVMPPNWLQTAPGGNGTHGPLVINPGSTWLNQDFGNRQLVPDLTVTKTDGLDTAVPGQTMTYTMVVRNAGEAAAENATAHDTLPPQATYVSSTLEGTAAAATVTLNPAGDQLDWNLGTIAPDAQKTITVTVALDALFPAGTTPLTNVVSVATTTPEPNVLNNSAADVTSVTAGPTIGLTKTDAPDPVTAGANLTYTITWTVGGTAVASNVIVTDPLPVNTTFVSASNGGTVSNGSVTWTLGTQSPGATGTLTLVVKVASPLANGTVLTNTATIDSTENTPVNATATTTVQSAPSLSITKTENIAEFANPGQTVTYTITVSNAASATDTARSVVVTDTLPTGLAFDDGTTVKTFAAFDLPPGATQILTVNAIVLSSAPAGTYQNTAQAKGSNTPEVSAVAEVAIRLPLIAAATAPELVITKTVNREFVNPGQTVRYVVTVENTGDAAALNVRVTDTLADKLTFVDGGGRSQTFSIGTLDPGQKYLLTYDVRVAKDAQPGDYKNLAVARADNAPLVTATTTIEVRKIQVLATTGAGWLDGLIAGAGIAVLLAGFILWRRRQQEPAELWT